VEVTPETVRPFWEGEALGAAQPVAELLEKVPLPGPKFEFSPQGGVGLYVERGRASFRNVVVEPLP
jgi:hypothetical protein